MPYIPIDESLPGILGLLEFRPDTAEPIRELAQILLRGKSTLTPGERELIGTVVSYGNECTFCTATHKVAANLLLDDPLVSEKVIVDPDSAPVSEKMKALLVIARAVQKSGRAVTPEMVAEARRRGATDMEVHDTVLIAALFSMFNRYVDGLGSVTPVNADLYERFGHDLQEKGYLP